VARTAGRVDHPHLAVAELPYGGREGAVEDELLHELGCLQQRITLTRGFRQILVQVTQETGVPVWIGEVVHQQACAGIHLLPELAQGHGRITADAQAENRVVGFIKEGVQTGKRAGFTEGGQQVIAVAISRVGLKVSVMSVARQLQAPRFGGTAQPGTINQLVVFDKPQKHTAQQPMHASLGDVLVCPGFEGFGAAVRIARGLPLGLQTGFQLWCLLNPFQQITFQALEQLGQV